MSEHRGNSCWSRLVVSSCGVAALVSLTQAAAWADGFRNPFEGAAAMGRAGVRTTDGGDPSCAYHNPANLMDLKGSSVMPSAVIAYSKREFTAATGVSEKSEDPWTFLPAVFANWPLEGGKYAAGVAVTVPYGQASSWDENGIFKFGSPYFAQLRSVNVNPSLAMGLGESINVGAGVNAMWSDLEFRQLMPWLPMPAGLYGPSSRMIFKGDGVAIGGNVGITWKMTQKQRLALTYRSPMSVEYEGDFTMKNPPPPGSLPPGITASSDFKTEIDFPSVAVLGYSIKLADTLRVEANVEWVEHSRNQAMGIDIGSNNPLVLASLGSTSIPQNWDDTWACGIGADWAFDPSWTLRGGWYYFPTPVPESTVMPTLAEGDSNIFGIGLGTHQGAHAVDVAYSYNLTGDRTVDAPQNPIHGTYEFSSQLCSISYIYTF